MTDVLTSHATQPIATQPIPTHLHGDLPVSPGDEDLQDAARRYGTAAAAADAWRHASSEADDALRLADCDTLDAVNDDWEANLDSRRESEKVMGFTAVDPTSDSIDLTATGRDAEKAKLSYQRYKASAMRAEALYGQALREAEEAEKHLLEVSRVTYSSFAQQVGAPSDTLPETS